MFTEGPRDKNDMLISIYVGGDIKLWSSDLEDADGDVVQAVQNEIGHTGFVVEYAEIM